MPYKDKEAARACWRRRNATLERKAYTRDYNKNRLENPAFRQRAYEATKRWNAKPESLEIRAEYQKGRRRAGIVKAATLRRQEEIAGRPKPDRCEACGHRGRIAFDHCHERGHFRGWICSGCNCALGFVNDDIQRLRKLIAYLQRNKVSSAPQFVLPGL